MRRFIGCAAVLLLVVVMSCAKQDVTCAKPYIANGNTCCLDKDANTICDVDENATLRQQAQSAKSGADCSLCPPQFVTQKEEVIVYRYVCANQSIMAKAEDCGPNSNALLFTPRTDQDSTYISGFAARPACRGTFTAAELHLTLAQRPLNITFQVQSDPTGPFVDIGSRKDVDELYFYIGFCAANDCGKITDAQLSKSKAYLVRAQLQYSDRKITTREFIIDPTPNGDFGKKTC